MLSFQSSLGPGCLVLIHSFLLFHKDSPPPPSFPSFRSEGHFSWDVLNVLNVSMEGVSQLGDRHGLDPEVEGASELSSGQN